MIFYIILTIGLTILGLTWLYFVYSVFKDVDNLKEMRKAQEIKFSNDLKEAIK